MLKINYLVLNQSKMNIPFPVLTPTLIDYDWFNSDRPCDEEAELTEMEQLQKNWVNYVCQRFKKRNPVVKNSSEPMDDEADTDEDDGNEESDESEESHDDDEEDRNTYSPNQRNNNELEPDNTANEAELNRMEQTLSGSHLWP